MEPTTIDVMLQKSRSLEQALDDMRAQVATQPDKTLDRMITQIEAEIATRRMRQDARSGPTLPE